MNKFTVIASVIFSLAAGLPAASQAQGPSASQIERSQEAIKEEAGLLEGQLKEIGEGEVSEPKRSALGEAKKVSRELAEAAKYFKV